MRLRIPADIFSEMLSHAREGLPNETCGILAGCGEDVKKLYRGTNTDPSPVSYELAPREQLFIEKDIRRQGMRMLAIYHSHPAGRAFPSEKDRRLAVWDAVYIIIGFATGAGPEVKGYRLEEGRVEEVPLEITP